MELLRHALQVRGWPWAALGAAFGLAVPLCGVMAPAEIQPEAPPGLASAKTPAIAMDAARFAVATELSPEAPELGLEQPLLAVPTPLGEEALAAHIAAAWQRVVGQPIRHPTLAILWAHAALETGRGRRMLGHNFAGLKGEAPNGAGRLLWTWEEGSQGRQRVRRTFRVYRSAEQGAHDYVFLLTTRHRRATRAAERGSPVDFVAALADSDYFTHNSEEYARSVTSLTLEYLKRNPEPASATEL